MQPPAQIFKITLNDRVRVASVLAPDGTSHTHGLGEIGQPIRDFLGSRAEGYRLVIPADRRDLLVYRIDWDGRPNARGRYPVRRVSWSALQAPDLPELDPIGEEIE